jgi:lysozyme family protein
LAGSRTINGYLGKTYSRDGKLWSTMKIIRDASELERVEKKIRLHQAVYQKVQDATGVPWQMVAVIHLA